MATTAEKSPTTELLNANVSLLEMMIEAGYKAQTRGLNIAKVLVEGAGRRQERSRKFVAQLTDPSTPWYSPERYSAYMSLLVDNQNETLRIGREYIDELNAAAADTRQTVESVVKQAGKAREAQQAILGQGISNFRDYATTMREQTARGA